MISLSKRACIRLTLWIGLFPNARPDSFLFPFHKVGLAGNKCTPTICAVDLTRPMGSWRKAWLDALRRATVQLRWRELRQPFISRLAENPSLSEHTIRAPAGHVSRQMLERYSHIRAEAKLAAIQALENRAKQKELNATRHNSGRNASPSASNADAN